METAHEAGKLTVGACGWLQDGKKKGPPPPEAEGSPVWSG